MSIKLKRKIIPDFKPTGYRWTAVLTALLLFMVFIAGCSSAGSQDKDTGGLTPGEAPAEDDGSEGRDDDFSGDPSDRKVISDILLRMESQDVNGTADALETFAEDLGGYLQASHRAESAGSFYAELTVRVPSDRSREFTDEAARHGVIKEEKSVTDDVTAEYTDMESRLANARVQETRLLELFQEANTIDEMLYIQTQLDSLQERIEMYEGQIRLWDNLVDLATIKVQIYADASVITPESQVPRYIPASTVWERFANGVRTSAVRTVNGLSQFVIWLGSNLLQLLLILILLTVVIVLIRRADRRHKLRAPGSRMHQPGVPVSPMNVPPQYRSTPPAQTAPPSDSRPENERRDPD